MKVEGPGAQKPGSFTCMCLSKSSNLLCLGVLIGEMGVIIVPALKAVGFTDLTFSAMIYAIMQISPLAQILLALVGE